MAKDYLSQYDATAGNNTDVGGVSVAEGTAPSNINDAIREVMSHLSGFKSEFEVGADVASASALPVNVAGMFHDVTGTTTVTSFAATTNDTSKLKVLQFDGVLTLTHHATDLILLTGANRTTAAGDIGVYYEYASGDWREVSYFVAGTAYLSDLVSDTTPQLGGNLDTNSNEIVTTSNADLLLSPNGTGAVSVANVTDYENNVTSDDDIPNKKYVDDNVNTITLGTEQATTSGTVIDFTSIPSGTKRIIVQLEQVSTGGTSDYMIQIGDSVGIETSGYTGGVGQDGSADRDANSTGFEFVNAAGAANVYDGTLMLTLKDSTNFTWSFFWDNQSRKHSKLFFRRHKISFR